MKPENVGDPVEDLVAALARNDIAFILTMLDEGRLSHDWTDDRGYTLLHFAVARGDRDFCDALIWQHGLSVQARNEEGQTPYHMALIFGHEDIARNIKDAAKRRLPSPPPSTARRRVPVAEALPVFDSLAAFRAAPYVEGCSAMALYALQGRFADVIALAHKTGEVFLADDLLVEVQPGESLILRLLQSEMADGLFDDRLWGGQRGEVERLRQSLPRLYRGVIDSSGLLTPSPPKLGEKTPPPFRKTPHSGPGPG